jgi:hypothetical protein
MKAIDYREHAKECREVADLLKPGEEREQLLKIAEAWDRLAAERERRLIESFEKA